MLVFLCILCTGMTFIQASDCWFGGDPRRFSDMFTLFVEHLYSNFAHLIEGRSMDIWVTPENVRIFQSAIFRRLNESFIVETTPDGGGGG